MSKTVRNPTIGHRINFLQTAAQTNGELLQIMYAVEALESKPAIPPHIHLQCEERFEVVQGQLGVVLDGAGRLQTYWETVFGLAEDGKVGENGLPHLLQLAVIAPLANSYAPNIPIPVMKLITKLFGGIGRLLGYKDSYHLVPGSGWANSCG